jgi:hypothetical protein
MKLSSLEAIAGELQRVKERYLIVGGLAVAAHGHGRAKDLEDIRQLSLLNREDEDGR